MAHVWLKKSVFCDNPKHLRAWGLVACEAHIGDRQALTELQVVLK